jgi:ubiquinone/menaquinone biosynthesis C-methylase UbiE
MTEQRLQNNISFHLMSLELRFRDWLHPPVRILQEAGVRPGMTILDFGCGPGSYSLAAAGTVGPAGRVYALDIHPLAIESMQRTASKQRVNNITTILGSDIDTLPEETIDMILLFDTLHDIAEPVSALAGMHRVLKPDGHLVVSDHHLEPEALITAVTADGLFAVADCNYPICQFVRRAPIKERS